MSRSPSPPGCGLGPDTLVTLADVVDRGLALGPGDPARLVRVRAAPAPGLDDDELELGFRTLEGDDHPLDVLLGFRAPDDWAAIGVAAVGRARPVDDDTTVVGTDGVVRRRVGRGPGSMAVRTVHLVGRSGAWTSRWQPIDRAAAGGGEPAAHGGSASSADTDELPNGRLDDALRRAVGLPTAPPPGDTGLLWAVQWLDALLVAAAGSSSGRRRLRPLAALVAAHPAVRAFTLDPATVDVERLVAEGRRLASLRGWTQLRRTCAQGTPDGAAGLHPLPADLAAWLDDGAFARWVLGGWPDLADLRTALSELLAPAAVSVIDDALAGWGLTRAATGVTTEPGTDATTVPRPDHGEQ